MWRLINAAAFAVVVHQLHRLKEIVVATQAENQAAIDAVGAQLEKAKSEIVSEITALENAANAGQTLDFGPLRTTVQSLDDLNPDAPAPEPTPEPAPPVEETAPEPPAGAGDLPSEQGPVVVDTEFRE